MISSTIETSAKNLRTSSSAAVHVGEELTNVLFGVRRDGVWSWLTPEGLSGRRFFQTLLDGGSVCGCVTAKF